MTKQSPASLVIQRVKRTRKRLFVAWHNGTEDRSVNSTENALPEFQAALDALAPLVCEICHLPEGYTQDMRIMGVVMGEQGGADTVSILAQKSLDDAGKALSIATPPRLLSDPTDPGTYTPPLTEAQAELVYSLIEAAKDYAKGNRAQGELPGIGKVEDDPDDDEGGGEQPVHTTVDLPLAADGVFASEFEASVTAPKKRGRKPKVKAE